MCLLPQSQMDDTSWFLKTSEKKQRNTPRSVKILTIIIITWAWKRTSLGYVIPVACVVKVLNAVPIIILGGQSWRQFYDIILMTSGISIYEHKTQTGRYRDTWVFVSGHQPMRPTSQSAQHKHVSDTQRKFKVYRSDSPNPFLDALWVHVHTVSYLLWYYDGEDV